MKLMITFLALALHVCASGGDGYGQTVTLHKENASLAEIFKEIKQQTGYNFLYDGQLLKKAKPVDINVTNAPLREALDICFRNQPLDYTILNNAIVIQLKKNKETGSDLNYAPMDVRGVITGENEAPVQGATVTVKESSKITTTDYKGEFAIKDVNENDVLVVTSVGYDMKEVPIEKKSNLQIKMKVAIGNLDEVQVIAYGITSKRLSTGNVSTVKAKDIEKQPVSNPLLALQGRVPGMFITQATGLPGAGVTVQIRGQNSMANGNDPLYIVDGVPYTSLNLPSSIRFVLGSSNNSSGVYSAGSPFNYLNPADIESIDILKDADATAIYGSRGANGVILITTKKGKAGSMKFDVNMQHGWGTVERRLKLLNTRQYLDMRYEAFKNDNAVPNPNADYDLTLWDTTRYTDWQKELIGGTAQYSDVQVSVYGGNEFTQYRVAAGYHRETTVFPGDFNDQRGTVQFNITGVSPNKKIRLLLSGVYTKDNNQLSSYDLTEQAVKLAPNAPALFHEDGSINWAPNAAGVSTWPWRHPASMMLIRFKSRTNNLVSNAVMSYQVFKGLEAKASFGYTNLQTNDVQKIPLVSQDPATWAVTQRRSSFVNNTVESWIIEPQIAYQSKLMQGNLTVTAGATIQQNRNISQTFEGSGFNSDLVLEDIASAATVTIYPGINSTYQYNAVFSRLSYNWRDKYIVNLTARRDGTSRFGPANRFQNFGGIGLGWIFSKWGFFQKHLPIINHGKLRMSYGTTGSDQVGDYTFMDLYNPINTGVPYQGVNGTVPNRIYTPDLAWEKTNKLEAGLDIGFANNKVLAQISFYRNRSTNQLIEYSLPSVTGFTSVKKNLGAIVQNKGWEFEVTTVNIKTKNFQWTTSGNLSINRNKLVSGAVGLSAFYQQKIGYPLSSRFLYRFMGVNLITGLYQVGNAHGVPTSSPNPVSDKTVLIDFTPKFYGGIQNNITWKRLQLDFLFQFVNRPNASVYLYNYIPGFFNGFDGSNQPVTVLDRWREPGDVKPIQRFSQNTSTLIARENALQSDQAYGDASYMRLKNLSLSWQLPDSWQKKTGLQNARIYIQGQNLLTITNYQGLDPETMSSLSLPPLRVITIGVQVVL